MRYGEKNSICLISLWLLFILAICALLFYRLPEQKMPIVLMDEFGYWSNGALFAGLDWSNISQYNSYYSYGYGIILFVLIKIIGNSNYLYQAALVVNALFLIGIMILSYKAVVILYPQIDKVTALMIAFIVTIYPGNLANLHIAWDEIFMTFLFTCSFYTLVKFINCFKYRYFVAWYLSIFLSYITHQRALGVVLTGIFLALILKIMRTISWKQLLFFIGSYIILFVVHGYVKQEILSTVLLNNNMSAVNDYPSIVSHVRQWFNIEGFTRVCCGIIGRMAYFIISTYCLVGIYIWNVLQKIIISVQNYKMKFMTKDKYIIVFLYLLFAVSASILISSIFMLNHSRVDGLIHSRYVEWCIGPWILIALGTICSEKINIKVFIENIIISIIVILTVTQIYYRNQGWEEYVFICAPSCFFFYRYIKNYKFLLFALMIVILFVLFYSILHVYGGKTRRGNIVIMTVLIMFYIVHGKMMIDKVLESNYRSEVVTQMYHEINEINDKADIFFIKDDGQTIWYVADLQILEINKKIKSIKKEEIENVHTPFFLILDTYSEYGKMLGSNQASIAENWQVSLYYINEESIAFGK